MVGYLEEFPTATRLPPATGSDYKDAFIKFCLEELTCIVSPLSSDTSNICYKCTGCSAKDRAEGQDSRLCASIH